MILKCDKGLAIAFSYEIEIWSFISLNKNLIVRLLEERNSINNDFLNDFWVSINEYIDIKCLLKYVSSNFFSDVWS